MLLLIFSLSDIINDLEILDIRYVVLNMTAKMALKTLLNYSPNFNPKKRNSKQIKFIIFHYTGMKKESEAIRKLTKIQSEVSSHYLIKKNGEIANNS